MASTTLSEQINSLATRIGTECKTLRTQIGTLTSLSTSDKTSLVGALNEVRTAANSLSSSVNSLSTRMTAAEGTANTNKSDVAGLKLSVSTLQSSLSKLEGEVSAIQGLVESQTNINDSLASSTTTYSSSKIESVVTEAKQAVKNDLLGGAGAAYDTLKELADLIQTNASAIGSLKAIAAGHVRFDQAQSLGDPQKQQARTNIGAAAASDLTKLQGTVTTVQSTANQAASDIASLETAVGNTGTDFVAAFETALEASA